MKKIVIFGGTIEGRQLVEALCGTEVQLYVCVATYYAATLLPMDDNVEIMVGRLDKEGMSCLFERIQPDICLDATHPYALEVTENAMSACGEKGISYIRVVREQEQLQNYNNKNALNGDLDEKFWMFESVKEAAEFLATTSGRIFITTGSKELEAYTVIPEYRERCIVRVLSTPVVIEKCNKLGFQGKNLIAMQGPFSTDMNELMLRESGVSWMVTKSSGAKGGYPEKCEAAMRAGVKMVVIGRPLEQETCIKSFSETLAYLIETYQLILQKPNIYLVAMGPGNENLLTAEAKEVLQEADVLIGAPRILEIWKHYKSKPYYSSYKPKEIKAYIKKNPQYHNIAICYSGDVGFYSGAKGMGELLKEYKVRLVSGISSVTYFLNRINVPWDQVFLASCHGKSLDIVTMLKNYSKVCVLLGGEDSVASLCQDLLLQGMKDIRITVGERLSYENENITEGSLETFVDRKFDSLAVALFEQMEEEDI